VTEFSYRAGDASQASVYLSFQARGATHEERTDDAKKVMCTLRGQGFDVTDLASSELAKAHLRHLGGGRVNLPNERLIRFEFPERPGALSHFLDALNTGDSGWNVSLFQYRNHGADIGRVLAGIEVPPEQLDQMTTVLERVGYRYYMEDENPLKRHYLNSSS